MQFYVNCNIKDLSGFLFFCRCWFGKNRKLSTITQEEMNKVINLYFRRG